MNEPKQTPTDPEDGTLKRPTCKVEDHKWLIHIDGGSVSLECLDPHTEEEIAEMHKSSDGVAGCLNGDQPECLVADFGPLKLKWEKESHGWEYPNDYDYWLEVDDG